jgi:lipoate---protein ligase
VAAENDLGACISWIEHSELMPEANLALDEAIVDYCEEHDAAGFLRFWESSVPFVVVGYSNQIETEVNRAECINLGIPILRRCTGGGTVLQGPGCYNYTLCLPIESRVQFETITSSNRFIMEQNRDALAAITGLPIQVQGHTDLTVEGVKCSGNAQRRKRKYLLFHGTFLLESDLGLVEKVLKFPSHQPAYRAGRPHSEFIRNLPVSRSQVRTALIRAWEAQGINQLPGEILKLSARLIATKYLTSEWNEKF